MIGKPASAGFFHFFLWSSRESTRRNAPAVDGGNVYSCGNRLSRRSGLSVPDSPTQFPQTQELCVELAAPSLPRPEEPRRCVARQLFLVEIYA